jgi:hypothetical protein
MRLPLSRFCRVARSCRALRLPCTLIPLQLLPLLVRMNSKHEKTLLEASISKTKTMQKVDRNHNIIVIMILVKESLQYQPLA